MINEKKFPEGMVPLASEPFMFSCHAGVRCFTVCCKNVDMILYPYDIIRLKTALAVSSSEFLQRYARLVQGDNPYFPTLMLKVRDDEEKSCPFLSANGCSVYLDRPSACRMYPLERAVDRTPDKHRSREYYFLVRHSYCHGHEENSMYTVREWVRDQRLDEYNAMNELWTEMDTVFSGNPWQGEGAGGRRQRLSFMVCYDIDAFRLFVQDNKIIEHFQLSKDNRRRIAETDAELMKFGFEWLKLLLTGRSSLIRK
ncbi:MAG: YkgJ family cysteine cluster protein [Desulfobulbaceae bacterium]|nr:MAG: YkgJ family cysteine cluster protein [Desulfobulbaceae bacterium]